MVCLEADLCKLELGRQFLAAAAASRMPWVSLAERKKIKSM